MTDGNFVDIFLNSMTEGQTFITTQNQTVVAVNPHRNHDEPNEPFIVYDNQGNSYFEEDIDVEKSINATYHTVFAKFRIPKNATQVQAAIVYSTDNGITWSNQHQAELTIAKPDDLPYLPLDIKENHSDMRHFGQSFLDNMWRDGFNECLSIFDTGKTREKHIMTDMANSEEYAQKGNKRNS